MLENMRNAALGIGIALILPITMHYGFTVFKLSPKAYFIGALITGLIAVAAGVITRLGFVGFGAILGGVFCVIGGYSRYWLELTDMFRFVSLLIFLVSMVIASYYSVTLKR